MPRPPSFPHDELQKRILAVDGIVDLEGKISPPSATVWTKLSDDIGVEKLTPKYLYVYVSNNRNDCYTKLLEHHNITRKPDLATFEDTESFTSVSASPDNSEGSDENVIKPKRTFSVLLSAATWLEIAPIFKTFRTKKRGSRTRLRMPSDYANKLRRQLWSQHKIPCPFTVKYAYTSQSETRTEYVKIVAYCKECGAEATGRVISEPLEGENVIMLWTTNDSRGMKHDSRQRLQGEERDIVARQLLHDSCERYKREIALDNMDPGDPAPPFLYKNTVLRQAKSEKLDLKLGIVRGKDAIQNLMLLKYKEPYAGSIHDIGADKFLVHYYSPQQLEVYRQHSKNAYVSLSLDATGSLVKRLLRPHGCSSNIFLYEGVIHNGTSQLPVVQMLSEKQDSNTILYWLNEWERSGINAPNEVVVDNSPALKSAVSRSFCRARSFNEVREKSFSYLRGMTDTLPPCFLRLDSAHFIKNVKLWPCWRDGPLKRLKQFYLYSCGLLMKAESIGEFETILRHILIIALSPFEGSNEEGLSTPMEESLQIMSRKIKVTNFPDHFKDQDEPEHFGLSDIGEGENDASSIKAWLQNIWNLSLRTVDSVQGERMNPYFSEEIGKKFLEISSDFAQWSAVLVRAYKSPFLTASSATVESDFKVLKKDILKGVTCPMRVDRFLCLHLSSIEGQCLVSQAKKDVNPKVRAGERRAREMLEFTVHSQPPKLNPAEDEFPERHGSEDGPPKIQMEEQSLKLQNDTPTVDPEDEVLSKPKTQTKDLEEAPYDLNFCENWRNKGAQRKQPKKQSYLDPNDNMFVAIEGGETKAPKKRLLLNGNKFRKPIVLNPTTRVFVNNTCPIDSILQVLGASFTDNAQFRQQLYDSMDLLHKTIRLLAVKGAETDTYKSRAELVASHLDPKGVLPINSSKHTRKNRQSVLTITYDCFDNAANLARKLITDTPSALFEVYCEMTDCTWKETYIQECIEINIDFILNEGIDHVEEAITVALNRLQNRFKRCGRCNSKIACRTTIGPIFLVNVDFISDHQMKSMNKHSIHNRPYKLDELNRNINVENEHRRFAGLAAYETGHYVGFSKRANGNWEAFNDLDNNVKRVPGDSLVCPHLLIYTV